MKLRQKKLLVCLACLLSLICLVGSAFASNIVINGGFESGNTGFTSTYTNVVNGWPPDLSEGKYAIGSDPNYYHELWASFGPYEGSKMMIVNGATISGVNVWSQSVTAAPNTTYYFSAEIASQYATSPAVLDFSINNGSIGTLNASSTVGLWQNFYATWNSGAGGPVILGLVNQNTVAGGNDFCLDNIQMDTVNPGGHNVTPAPSTVLLLGSGMLGLALLGRRKFGKK